MSGFYESVKEQSVAIYETVVEGFADFKTFVAEAWPLLILLFVILSIALYISDPIPPNHVVMAVGPKGSADDILAHKYQDYFKSKGIKLELINTEGSVDNLNLLKDPKSKVEAAFVLTGTMDEQDKGINTLGSVGYEPLWCFYRGEDAFITSGGNGTKFLLTHKVNIGQPGSGTYHLINKLLGLINIEPNRPNFSKYSLDEAVEKISQGKIDALCFADSVDNPNVQKLVDMKDVHLSHMDKSEALSRKVQYLEMVTVPKGALNLVDDIPKSNVNMIAATREILVYKDLHPAIQTLFLMAAKKINGGESFFAKEGEFPTFKDNFIKRSEEAETFYAKGEPYTVSWLPFWLSEFARRLVLTLLPLAAIAYPIVRSTPNYYKNRVRGRINKMYGEIKFLEQQLVQSFDEEKKFEYLNKLKEIEVNSLKMKVPKSISQDYFTMRSSIEFINSRILSDFYKKEQEENLTSNSLQLDLFDEDKNSKILSKNDNQNI